jgi:hypothetical protein
MLHRGSQKAYQQNENGTGLSICTPDSVLNMKGIGSISFFFDKNAGPAKAQLYGRT